MHDSAANYNGPRRQQSNRSTLRRAPAKIQNRINHSLRRRVAASQDYSPVNPCVKYFLFFVNMTFMLVGAALASICIFILVKKDKTVNSFIEFLFDPACLFTLVGLVAFLVALVGLYGALRENICCLKTYHYTLSLLLLGEILVIILTVLFSYREQTLADIGLYPEDAFEDAIVKYRDDPDMQDFIDNLQDVLSCCGASNDDEGYKDWNANRYFNCSKENDSPEKCSVPFSCCKIGDGDQINYRCGANMLESTATDQESKIYTRGCLKALKVILADNKWIVGGILVALFVLQLFFICCSKALISQIEEQLSKWM